MYDVYLDSKEARKIEGYPRGQPLSSNVFVHIEDVKLTAPAPDHRRPWLSEDSRLNAYIMVDSIKGAILSGLELLSLYNRRAERELRAQNRRNRNSAIPAVPHIPEPLLDPNLPRELVTGVMILMPSANRPSSGKHEKWEEEQLPYVAIGIKDKQWKGRIDVDGGPESSVAS
ncbi:hypothetical protein FRC05_009325 [Tulasnella sp. 425]|nr:hypothetical protein FRC05_009325 [Tulasnella sp. 425]